MLSLHPFPSSPSSSGDVSGNRTTSGGGLMDAVPKVNGKNSSKLHHAAWGALHCFR